MAVGQFVRRKSEIDHFALRVENGRGDGTTGGGQG